LAKWLLVATAVVGFVVFADFVIINFAKRCADKKVLVVCS